MNRISLINEKIEVHWSFTNKDWYISKGYNFTKIGDKIIINSKDLSLRSHIKIHVMCDNCFKDYYIKNDNYNDIVNENGKNYCHDCAIKLYATDNMVKTKYKKSKYSFKEWCMQNDKIYFLELWDYNLNITLPENIPYKTKKNFWFKCQNNIHDSELHKIFNLTHNKGELKCTKCESFAQYLINNFGEDALNLYWDYDLNTEDPWKIYYNSNTIIWMKCGKGLNHDSFQTKCNLYCQSKFKCPLCINKHRKIIVEKSLGYLFKESLLVWSDNNKDSPFEYTPWSHKIVWWKCPKGLHKDYKRDINDSNRKNFRCPICSYSLGELRIETFLIKNGVKFIPQKEYDGLIGLGNGKLSYDFYLPDYNLLIEFQGEQHRKFCKGLHTTKKDFEKQQEHDRRKRKHADNNKIKLLEIWYGEMDDIESILSEKLKIKYVR